MAFHSRSPPPRKFGLPFPSISLVFVRVFRSLTLDRPPWLHGSLSRPKDSDPAPPRGWHHLLQKIHTGSFPGRPSGSITSPCSTTCLSQNKVSPPPMRSLTSLSRTMASRHFVLPCPRSSPGCAGVPLKFAFQSQHHCFRSRQVGRVLCPGHLPDLPPVG